MLLELFELQSGFEKSFILRKHVNEIMAHYDNILPFWTRD